MKKLILPQIIFLFICTNIAFSAGDENLETNDTTINQYEDAKRLFSIAYAYPSDKHDTSDNCYNRAHFWSRAFEVGAGIKTAKVYLIKNKKLAETGPHKWWYHVAPVVFVKSENDWFVMDLTYTKNPIKINNWLNKFLPGEDTYKSCIKINKLSEFNRDSNRPCAFMITNMYHYGPSDSNKVNAYSQWHCTDLFAVKKMIDSPGFYEWSDLEKFIPGRCIGNESDSKIIQSLINLSQVPHVKSECEQNLNQWTDFFASDFQRNVISTIACENNPKPADEIKECLDGMFFWVNKTSTAFHRRLIAATSCRGGGTITRVKTCMDEVYKWTSSNADIFHRREVAAIACGNNSAPEEVINCIQNEWEASKGKNFEERRIKAAEKCSGIGNTIIP